MGGWAGDLTQRLLLGARVHINRVRRIIEAASMKSLGKEDRAHVCCTMAHSSRVAAT